MSALPLQVTNWLYNVIQPSYVYKELVYSHVCHFLLKHFNKSLKFKIRTSIYTSGISGKSSLLLNLWGNIPVGNINVPVQIWIPFLYPYGDEDGGDDEGGVPLVYITPSSSNGWHLRPGNHVDSQGRFYHPFLVDWRANCSLKNSANSTKYNILNLLAILSDTFFKEVPLSKYREQETVKGFSDNPPKPEKIPIKPSTYILEDRRKKEVSHLDDNNSKDSTIPLKYQKPLPLPDVSFERKASHNAVQNFSDTYHTDDLRIAKDNFTNRSDIKKANLKSNTSHAVDLIDKEEGSREMNKRLENNYKTHTRLSDQIIIEVNKRLSTLEVEQYEKLANFEKVSNFNKSVSHHYNQARANQSNLNYHIDYIASKVDDIRKLNENLLTLDSKNSKEPYNVWISSDRNVDVDDLVVPDSMLVNQLYDVVSEIKAFKDSVGLVSGSFDSEVEIMNNDRIDICMKGVRSIARDVFWLELTKNEIASSMHKRD